MGINENGCKSSAMILLFHDVLSLVESLSDHPSFTVHCVVQKGKHCPNMGLVTCTKKGV